MKLDEAQDIRKGEELDEGALLTYLIQHIPGLSGEMEVRQFPGGASNLTYLLKIGERQLVMRRPPFGAKIKSAHDMGREHKVLSALSRGYNKAPRPLVYCEDESVIGASFYVMERVEGVILRHNMGQELDKVLVGDIADSLLDSLVELHHLDYEGAGLGDLGRPSGYIKRQVDGWSKRYIKAKTEDQPEIEFVGRWLDDHQPTESGASLIHNDFKHDNVILAEDDLTEVKAILDWEMCTLGDPLMDLGTTLSYWMNPDDPDLFRKSFPNPSLLEGNPTREGLVHLYSMKSGKEVAHPVFLYAFGLWKTAVVVQQIYYRYAHGHTQDQRFANFNFVVKGFGTMASRAIELGSLDKLM